MNMLDPHAAQPILRAGTPLDRAAGALILLHGRGGSAEDILTLGEALADDRFALLAPQAAGHTWYPNSFLASRGQNEPWLSSALQNVEAVLALAQGAGIPTERIAIAGFSQGACLATEFVGRHPLRYAALLAYTGGLIGPLDEPITLSGNLDGTPALFSSGDPDPHVPWQRVQQSADLFAKIGAEVLVERHPGRPHTILASEVRQGRELLSAVPTL
jgi:phospholipase/carboxylesterase